MKKAQSAIEYMVLVIIVAGAFLTMQVYIKRGIQGSWRQGVDELGMQYDQKNTISDTTYCMVSNTTSEIYLSDTIEKCQADGCYSNRVDYTNTQETTNETRNLKGY